MCAVLLAPACSASYRAFHEFDVSKPSAVAERPPPPVDAPGRTHKPYEGKPQYLASARPLQATTSPSQAQQPQQQATEPECTQRSQRCDERLRAVLASIDGQILTLSTPPTPIELQALKLQVEELRPLLGPYPDITAEADELAGLVDQLPSQKESTQTTTKRRLVELADLIRVQLAAAQ